MAQPWVKPTVGTPINTALPISNGLVFAMPCNEGSGAPADNTGNTTLQVSRSVPWVTDTPAGGPVLQFGSGNVWGPSAAAFNLNRYTIIAGFKSTAGDIGLVYCKYNIGAGSIPYSNYINWPVTSQVTARVWNGSSFPASINEGGNDSAWHQSTITRDDNYLSILLDNANLSQVGVGTSTDFTNDSDIQIGGLHDNSSSWPGYFSFLFIWNRVLTTDEINAVNADPFAMYAVPAPPTPPTPPTAPVLTLTANVALTFSSLPSWATSQDILRSSDGGVTWDDIAVGVSGTTYDDTTAVPGHTYRYAIYARSDCKTAWSPSLIIKCLPVPGGGGGAGSNPVCSLI